MIRLEESLVEALLKMKMERDDKTLAQTARVVLRRALKADGFLQEDA